MKHKERLSYQIKGDSRDKTKNTTLKTHQSGFSLL